LSRTRFKNSEYQSTRDPIELRNQNWKEKQEAKLKKLQDDDNLKNMVKQPVINKKSKIIDQNKNKINSLYCSNKETSKSKSKNQNENKNIKNYFSCDDSEKLHTFKDNGAK